MKKLLSFAIILFAACGNDSTFDNFYNIETKSNSLLSTALKIADPYRSVYPLNTVKDNFARSIWDMQTYNGRIYIGSGDWHMNRGPVQIWSFNELGFQKEVLVDEEAVERLRVYDGKLFVPGIDSREPWELGNFYFNDNGVWTKRRTVPNGVHVWDVAYWNNQLFVYFNNEKNGQIMVSNNLGLSWNPLTKKPFNGLMMPMDSYLFVLGYKWWDTVFTYSGGRVKKIRTDTFNNYPYAGRPPRMVKFGTGVLFTRNLLYNAHSAALLFFIDDLKAGAKKISGFDGNSVQDVLVLNNKVFILTSEAVLGGTYIGRIFSSADLASWSKEAEFSVPAPPYSFERLNNIFYIGLGNDGYVTEDLVPDTASGTIWKIQ